jgi:hypothetical protein
MKSTRRLLLASVLATVLLPSAMASASRLGLSANTFRIVSGEGERPGFVICPLTLEGSFHSTTLLKVFRGLIGLITRAAMNEERCNGGSGRYLAETLPWHLQYAGFAGTLPNISAIGTRVIGLGIVVTRLGVTCLYRTTDATPGILIWNRELGGAIRSIRWGENERIPSTQVENELCRTMTTNLIGTSEIVTELESTRLITVTLI